MINKRGPKSNVHRFPRSAQRLIKRADRQGMRVDIDVFDNSIVKRFRVDVSTTDAYGSPASVSCVWTNKWSNGKRVSRFTEATGFNRFGYSDHNTLEDVSMLLALTSNSFKKTIDF